MESQISTNSNQKNIELDNIGIEQLNQTKKWTMFVSILGFIFLGLMILLVLVTFTIFSDNESSGFSASSLLPLLLLTIVYFFPIYFLYQFSSYSKQAIVNGDSKILTTAFKYLRKHYQFMGILIIIVFGLYIILGVIMLLTGELSNLI